MNREKIKSGSKKRYMASILAGITTVIVGGLIAFLINFLQIEVIRETQNSNFAKLFFTFLPYLTSIISIFFAGLIAGMISRRNGLLMGAIVGTAPALLVVAGRSMVYLYPQSFLQLHYRSLDLLTRLHLPTNLLFIVPYILLAASTGWLGERLTFSGSFWPTLTRVEHEEETFQDF